MRRGIAALVVLCALLAAPAASRADAIADSVADLQGSGGYKLRLQAALVLAKSTDDRAILALVRALDRDREPAVRRVAALALQKNITARTRKNVRDAALDGLRDALQDRDKKVRAAAKQALATLDAMFSVKAPRVFITIESPRDRTRKAPSRAVTELDKAVRARVARASKDYALEWPDGALPTGEELEKYGTRAFAVSSAVAKVTISKRAGRAEVACTVEIRVAPWGGTDGDERWVADQTGNASGSGKATTGTTDAAIAGGVVDCVAAVAEQLTDDKIVPFIRRLASSR